MTLSTRSRRTVTGTVLALLLTVGTVACGNGGSEDANNDATTTTTAGNETTTTSEADEATTTSGDDVSTTTTGDDVTTTTEEDVTTTTDGEPSSDPQDYVDALVANIEGDTGAESFGPGQVECVAGNFVDVIGIEALQAAGISPEEFAEGDGSDFPPEVGVDEAKANELFDQFDACEVDLIEVFSKIFAAEGEELTAEQQACLEDVFTEENLRASFVADYLGEELEDDPLEEAGTCVGFDEPDTSDDTAVDPAEPGGD